jgi:PAS domain S-box-containing protein
MEEGIVLVDSALHLDLCNGRWREMFAIPDALARPGTPWRDVLRYRAGQAAGERDDAAPAEEILNDFLEISQRCLSQAMSYQRRASGRVIRVNSAPLPAGGFMRRYVDITEAAEKEEHLLKMQERYALALRSAHEGLYDWDIVAGTIFFSERLREQFDLPAGVLRPDDWMQRILPEDLGAYKRAHIAHLKGDTERFVFEYRMVGHGGKMRWVRQHGIALRGRDGRGLRLTGSVGDITGHREAVEALAESQATLRREREVLTATLENMDQGIFMADSEMQLVAHNRRFQTLFDLPDSLFVGPVSMISVIQSLIDRGDLETSPQKVLDEYLGRDVCGTLNIRQIRRPDGRVLEARNVPLPDGGFVRTFTDVTERARAEDAVRELIEAMPLPLVVSSVADNRYLYVNEHAHRMFGVTAVPGDPASLTMDDIYVDPEDRVRLLKCLTKRGRVTDFEARLKTSSGEAWVLMSAHRLTYRGEPAVIVASTNITERKRLEADLKAAKDKAETALHDLQSAQQTLIQAEKMASLGGLVAGVAHEINTPVGITLTTATHLEEKLKGLKTLFDGGQMRRQDFATFMEVADHACQLLVSNCTRAANLIQSFKQVAVDQTSDERRHFDLGQYIQEVLLSLGPKLKRTPFRVEVDCPDGLEVDSYPGPLSQVLTNLIMNSLVHGFDGRDHGLISIAVVPPDADGMVELRYADDGCGIPSRSLRRIFDPFFTTKRGHGGSGLGLNIVYNIVTQTLQGSVRAEAEEGRGAAFVLRFPVRAGRRRQDDGAGGAMAG